jgi:hypothetical protein
MLNLVVNKLLQQVIRTNLDDPNLIFSADLDGDGDMDVLSTFRES